MANNQLSPTAAKWIGRGLLLACLGFGCALVFSTARTIRFLNNAERVPGVVLELKPNYGKKRSVTYAPVFRFTDKTGQEHTITSSISSNPPDHQVGDTVEVLYDPNDVSGAETRSFSNWFGTIFFGIFTLVTGIIGTVFTAVSRKLPAPSNLHSSPTSGDTWSPAGVIPFGSQSAATNAVALQKETKREYTPIGSTVSQSRSRTYIALGLLVVSLSLAALTLLFTIRTNHFLNTAERVPGTVVELIPKRGSKNSTTYAPRFEFTDKTGKLQSVVSSTSSSPPAYSEGEQVEILYDPNDVQGAEASGIGIWLNVIITSFFALAFGAGGTIMLLKNRRPKYT